MSLTDLITQIIEAETTNFYKTWVIRSKGGLNDYYDTERYFQRNGIGKFQFETCWAYIQYKKWIESDEYHKDIENIRRCFEDDIIEGFDSHCEEIISMEDEDTDDFQQWINIRNEYKMLRSKAEKLNYLSNLYAKQWYYPTFNNIWLYTVFHDRIVSDI